MNQSNVINTFRRTETKYRITQKQMEQLLQSAGNRLKEDQYFQYTVHNIYMDTRDNAMIIHCLEHPEYKEKLRLRTYGSPSEDMPVYLELKKKYEGVTAKRRTSMSLRDAAQFCMNGCFSGSDQISQELASAIALYHPIPKIFAAYDRLSYAGTFDSDLRMTFDTNLHYRSDHIDLSFHGNEKEYLKNGEVLLEIKAEERYPLWLVSLLQRLQIRPSSFSKYGAIYKQDLSEQLKDHRVFAQEPVFESNVGYESGRSVLHV